MKLSVSFKTISASLHRTVVKIENDKQTRLLWIFCFCLLVLLTTVFYGLLTPVISGIRLPTTGEIRILNWEEATAHASSFILAVVLTFVSSLWLLTWIFRQWGIRLSSTRVLLLVSLALTPFLLSRLLLVYPILRPVAELFALSGFFLYAWLIRVPFNQPSLLKPGRLIGSALSVVVLLACYSLIGEILFGY